jgi:hypothetical protein
VLVSDGVARNRSQRLPDGSPIVSSPLASTLIFGERDAVLVFTREQVQRVGDWAEHSGRRLAYIYATHERVHQSVVLIVCTTLCRGRTVG